MSNVRLSLFSLLFIVFMLPLLKNHGVVSVASCIVYCCNSYVCTLYDSMFYTRCCIPYLLCNQTWKMFVMIVWNIWFPNTSLLYPCACYLLLPPWMPSVQFLSNLWVTGWCKRLFFYIIDSKFAEEQVQASPGQRQRNLLSWGHWWTGPGGQDQGHRERDKLLLMAGKRSFCVDLSQGKWPSQEVCTGLLLKHPGMSRRQQKMEDKRGSNNHNGGSWSFTTTTATGEAYLSPRQTWGVLCQLISHRNV